MPGGRPIGTSLKPGSPFVWPSETDLILFPGTMKIMLTLQLPLVRTVLQDAFENLRAALLFEHAFPDLNLTVLFIRKTLVGAARSHLPRAVNIHKHLLVDDAYLDKLSRLVSFLLLKYDVSDHILSPALAFPFSEQKLRSGVQQSFSPALQ
jgi:hypothetical protein